LDGSTQIKFSFSLLIINVFVKVGAICYVSYAIVENYDAIRKPTRPIADGSDEDTNAAAGDNELINEMNTVPTSDAAPASLISPVRRLPSESVFRQKQAFWTPSP